MDKFKAALLKQMAGQKTTKPCKNCNKDTIFIIDNSGTAKCTEPGCTYKYEIDLTETIKGLKEMGVFVG